MALITTFVVISWLEWVALVTRDTALCITRQCIINRNEEYEQRWTGATLIAPLGLWHILKTAGASRRRKSIVVCFNAS